MDFRDELQCVHVAHALRHDVALRAVLSAAPEPRLRRVSAIRLRSLTPQRRRRSSRRKAPPGRGVRRAGLRHRHSDPDELGDRDDRNRSADRARPGNTDRPLGRADQRGIVRVDYRQRRARSAQRRYENRATGSASSPESRGQAMTIKIRATVHQPAKPTPFPFSSREVRGAAAIAVFPHFPRRALHPRSRLAWV